MSARRTSLVPRSRDPNRIDALALFLIAFQDGFGFGYKAGLQSWELRNQLLKVGTRYLEQFHVIQGRARRSTLAIEHARIQFPDFIQRGQQRDFAEELPGPK